MYMIYGYPKTGNTWLQVMFVYILDPSGSIAGRTSPRGDIFSHGMPGFNHDTYASTQFSFIGSDLSHKDIVLLIRNPGDTLVSLYMHNRYREKNPLYIGSVDEMVYDSVYGIDKYLQYYQKWDSLWKIPKSIYLIRYEDLLVSPYPILEMMLDKLKINYSHVILAEAIQFGNFKNMQKLEDSNHFKWSTLAPSIHSIKNARKVREGKIGNYRNVFKESTVSYIDKRTRDLPVRYGY